MDLSQLVGKTVKHKKFGQGIITSSKAGSYNGSYPTISVTVSFADGEKSLSLKDNFKDFLFFDDKSVQIQVEKYLKTAPVTPLSQKTVAPAKTKITKPIVTPLPAKKTASDEIRSFTSSQEPSSAVLIAELKNPSESIRILIVRDEEQQNSGNGIYWKQRTLSKRILNALFEKKQEIEYKGKIYSVSLIKKCSKYSVTLKEWLNITNPLNLIDLYVFNQKGVYDDPKNGYELDKIELYFPDKREIIDVPIYYQVSESKYFMNQETFLPLVNAHGFPTANLILISDSNETAFGTLNKESKLKQLGYNVQKSNGMPDAARQQLLSSIINNKKMTAVEIANHLEFLIHMNKNKAGMEDACDCWRTDLKYIQNKYAEAKYAVNFSDPVFQLFKLKSKKPVAKSSVTKNSAFQSASAQSSHVPVQNAPVYNSEKSSVSSTEILEELYCIRQPAPVNATAAAQESSDISVIPQLKEQISPEDTTNYKMRAELLSKRDILVNELKNASGLFNLFKRIKIKRQINEINEQLEELT